MKKKVVVGLSGGVDSSVAAYLLLEQGYEVIGLFMKNWHDDSVTISDACPWLEDSNDALLVAEKLGIPFQVIDLSAAYKTQIVDYMFAEYAMGRTPNPDILCNREIKFEVFLHFALQLGADFVATGHYCQKVTFSEDKAQKFGLLAGKDPNKDQSYFLCQLSQKQLARALFPIGGLYKSEVRKIAAELDLVTATKKDSQGLCFVGKIRLPEFLQQKLKPKPGPIIAIQAQHLQYAAKAPDTDDLEAQLYFYSKRYRYTPSDGTQVGTHQGAHYFTIGQRKGLGVGGTALPLFVLQTNVHTQTVYVGEGSTHPGLYRRALFVEKTAIHWVRRIRTDKPKQKTEKLEVMVRIRYRQPLQKATLYMVQNGLYILFDLPQSAVTPGQFVAWYLENELVGSGVIS